MGIISKKLLKTLQSFLLSAAILLSIVLGMVLSANAADTVYYLNSTGTAVQTTDCTVAGASITADGTYILDGSTKDIAVNLSQNINGGDVEIVQLKDYPVIGGTITLGENVDLSASTNSDGSSLVAYNASDLNTYRYIVTQKLEHRHTWKITAEGNTLKAETTCHDDDDCEYKNEGGKTYALTLEASNAAYNGHPIANAEVTGDIAKWNELFGEDSLSDIEYYDSNNNKVSPVNAGMYTAKITYTAPSSGETATAAARFIISPASIKISCATVADKTYDGTAKATVTSVSFDGLCTQDILTEGVDYTVTGEFDSADATGANAAKNATVKVTLKDSETAGNYSLYDTSYTVEKTISKAEQTKVPAAPTALNVTKSSISVEEISKPGEAVEYAISPENSAPENGWQDSNEFSGLTPDTTYYVFARIKENDNYKVGNASEGTAIATGSVRFNITVTTDTNGIAAKSGVNEVIKNGSFKAEAFANAGYCLDTVTVDGVVISTDALEDNSYTFENVTEDHEIAFAFAKDENADGIPDKYEATVTFKAENGKIDGAAEKTVVAVLKDENGKLSENGTATVEVPAVTPNSGYTEGSWNPEIKGTVTVSENSSYTYTCEAQSVVPSVKTGDSNSIVYWILLAVLSAAAMAFAIILVAKKERADCTR